MISLIFGLLVTVATLVALVMLWRLPEETPLMQKLGYSLAPILGSWLVALLAPSPIGLLYKGALLLGMLLLLLAVALLQSRLLPDYAAHAHLLFTYALYALAFASVPTGWPTPWAILLLAAAGALFYWLSPKLRELWGSVLAYSLLLFLATWQALEIATQTPQAWAGWVALLGMMLIIGAHLLQAGVRYRNWQPHLLHYALPLLLGAQLLLAWSVWG